MDMGILTRRQFIQASVLSLGGFIFRKEQKALKNSSLLELPEFPNAARLGRVLDGKVPVKLRPSDDSPTIKDLYADDVVVWLREVVGNRPMWFTQRFVETPEGYIFSPNLQPVQNKINQPLEELPRPEGMWAEVTVPYADLTLANPPARSPWLEYTPQPRLYYSQIMWIDQIRIDENNQVWYRASDRYGSFGDIFWVLGEAMRPLSDDDISPIAPHVEDKRVEVNLTYQTLSCFEGNDEVYFCRVSTGPKISSKEKPIPEWATPIGKHTIWRKLVSVHMTGGTTGGGYDIPGIGWTTLFSGQGMAIHSTFWHNSFGVPKSHGCVNVCPEDANWIFRWTQPVTSLEPGDVTISGMSSTRVHVLES